MPTLQSLRSKLVRSSEAPVREFFFAGGSEDVWSVTSASSTSDYDTDNVVYEFGGAEQNRRITMDGSSTFTNWEQSFSPPIDLSGTNGMLRWYVPEAYQSMSDTAQRLKFIKVIFETSAGNADVHTIYSPNRDMIGGFMEAPIIMGDLTGTFDLTQVTKIVFQPVFRTALAGDFLTLNHLAFYTLPSKARVFFRFDDGYVENASHADIAKANGFRVNLGIAPDLIGNGPQMDWATVRRLYRDGHKILNHKSGITGVTGSPGWRYNASSNITSFADRAAAMASAAATLIAQGVGDFAYLSINPGGSNNPGTSPMFSDKQLVAQGYCSMIWYAGAGGPGTGVATPQLQVRGQNEWAVRSVLMDGDTPATVLSWIDTAVARKAELFMHGHQNFSDADWTTICQGVKTRVDAGTLDVGTAADLVTPAERPTRRHGSVFGVGGQGILSV